MPRICYARAGASRSCRSLRTSAAWGHAAYKGKNRDCRPGAPTGRHRTPTTCECTGLCRNRTLLDVGRWTLVVGRWLLDVGCWTLVVGRWLLDVGCSTLNAQRST